MRETTIKGVEDGFNHTIYGWVSLIDAVMRMGKAVDDITYKVQVTGEQLLQILKEAREGGSWEKDIAKDHHYILTAYDW